MSSTRTGQNIDPQPIPDAEARTVPRPKTAATRLSVEELEEVESAAKRDGKSQAEWIRDTVLREARQRSASVDLVLAELSANRVIPDQIAQQVGRTTQEVSRLVGQSADQALARIEAGAEKAIRKAAVSEVGAKIERAIVGPMRTLEEALRKLRSSAVHAETASSNWRSFTNIFRWQQLAIAVLVGIVIGGAGTWYFASLPTQRSGRVHSASQKCSSLSAECDPKHSACFPIIRGKNQKPKSIQEPQPQVEAAPVTQQP
jgi:phosphoglycolate phosphatase-like HAD superfamily hydrolase